MAASSKSSRRLVLLLVLAWLLAACSPGQPLISVETTEFDFGDVKIGEIVNRDLIVSNTGSGTLIIEGITTSCGCTTAEIDDLQIQPGASTTLHITFDGGAHGDVTALYTRQVFIATNDPEQAELRVEFTANVIQGSNP